MENDPPKTPSLACPICQRPLKRTSDRVIAAFECEQCGPFSDFNGVSGRARAPGSGSGPGQSGSGL